MKSFKQFIKSFIKNKGWDLICVLTLQEREYLVLNPSIFDLLICLFPLKSIPIHGTFNIITVRYIHTRPTFRKLILPVTSWDSFNVDLSLRLPTNCTPPDVWLTKTHFNLVFESQHLHYPDRFLIVSVVPTFHPSLLQIQGQVYEEISEPF